MKRISLIILCFGLLLAGTASAESHLSISDLNRLAEKSLWSELFEKLEQVPPKERDARWQELLEESATREVSEAVRSRSPYALDAAALLTRRYPMLKESSRFSEAARSNLAAEVQACLTYADTSQCSATAQEVLAATKAGNTAEIVRAGRVISARGSFANSLRLFGPALLEEKDAALCDDEQVQEALVRSLQFKPDDLLAELALRVLNGPCRGKATEALKRELNSFASDSDYYRNVCPLLFQRDALQGLLAKMCEGSKP